MFKIPIFKQIVHEKEYKFPVYQIVTFNKLFLIKIGKK